MGPYSGVEWQFLMIALMVALPFIVLAAVLLPLFLKTTKNSIENITTHNTPAKKKRSKLLSGIALALNVAGLVLLLVFSKNGGQSHYHYLSNPYLYLHLGIILISLGVTVGLLGTWLSKRS